MIQIVHIENGINVNYDSYSENPEYIFAFDEKDTFIQKFTYPVEIFSDQIETILSNTRETIVIEDHSFLFYSLWTDITFSHYFAQTMPKLLHYDQNELLIIPKTTYTLLCKEILDILSIDRDKIFLLEDNVKYIFKNLKTFSHHVYQGPGGFVHDDMYNICTLLRNNLNITQNIENRKVYLKRDGKPNKKFGNAELGNYRKITNEIELISLLESFGFEVIELGNKTVKEKVELLKDISILVTPLGANCMNLIFSNSPRNILMLSNDMPIGPEYYINLCSVLNKSIINSSLLTYQSLNYNEDPKNNTNSPFTVNLDDVINFIK